MLKTRPGRSHKLIIQDLQLSNKDGESFKTGIRHFVRQVRQDDPGLRSCAKFRSSSEHLSSVFIVQEGRSYFVPDRSRYIWPADAEEIIRLVAEALCRQNSYENEDKYKRKSRKRISGDLEDITTDLSSWKKPRRSADIDCGVGNTIEVSLNEEAALSSNSQHSEYIGSPELPSPRSLRIAKSINLHSTPSSLSAEARQELQRSISVDSDMIPLRQLNQNQRFLKAIPEGHDPSEVINSPCTNTTAFCLGQSVQDEVGKCPKPITPNDSDCPAEPVKAPAADPILFSVTCGRDQYNLSGERCATVLRLTIARLDGLEANMRLAEEEKEAFDYTERIMDVIRRLAKDIRDRACSL